MFVTALLSAFALGGEPVRETTDTDIDFAIKSAVRYLWSRQLPSGSWERMRYCHTHRLPDGFPTAVITFALLEAGESYENDPRMRKAIEALAKIQTNDLRVRALRVMALSRAVGKKKNSPYREFLKKDLAWIYKSGNNGRWGNTPDERFGDNFCNHLALTALWEARLNGDLGTKSNAIFRAGMNVWMNRQKQDGGWAFSGLPDTKMLPDIRITAAGLASMYMCRDAIGSAVDARSALKARDVMTRAWGYLDNNFSETFMDKTPENANSSYTAFCIQQIGLASGEKFINNVDWYAVAARELARPQPYGNQYTPNAYWGPMVRGAFELIMLARGRLPLTFNKLNYGKDARWDAHPRDIARFSEYMQRNFERRMRWQIVRINDNVQTLLDAPIMLIVGADEMKLSDEQWARLREYTLRGGTLLFMPVKSGDEFLDSVKAKLKDLYKEQRAQAGGFYELKELPADHPLYNAYKKIPNGDKRFPLWGLSDGTRLLAVVSDKDVAEKWESGKYLPYKNDFILGVNFFRYATGQNALSTRMRPVFVTGDKVLPIKDTLKVGWVKHGGNWCSQPYALDYLAEKVRTENQVELKISKGVEIKAQAIKPFKLLWMTGSGKFKLTDEEVSVLRDFLYEGGMLMINAVGGAGVFQASAEALMDEVFQDDDDITSNYSAEDSPIMTGKSGDYRGPKLGKLERTTAFVRTHPKAVEPVIEYRNTKGRILVAMLRFGMHDTMDGHTAYNAQSYMPTSALDIAANIALCAMVSEISDVERTRYEKIKERAMLRKKALERTPLKTELREKQPVKSVETTQPAEPNKKTLKKKSVFIDDDF